MGGIVERENDEWTVMELRLETLMMVMTMKMMGEDSENDVKTMKDVYTSF